MFDLVIYVPACRSPSSWEQRRFHFATDEQRQAFNSPRGWLVLFDVYAGRQTIAGITV